MCCLMGQGVVLYFVKTIKCGKKKKYRYWIIYILTPLNDFNCLSAFCSYKLNGKKANN